MLATKNRFRPWHHFSSMKPDLYQNSAAALGCAEACWRVRFALAAAPGRRPIALAKSGRTGSVLIHVNAGMARRPS